MLRWQELHIVTFSVRQSDREKKAYTCNINENLQDPRLADLTGVARKKKELLK